MTPLSSVDTELISRSRFAVMFFAKSAAGPEPGWNAAKKTCVAPASPASFAFASAGSSRSTEMCFTSGPSLPLRRDRPMTCQSGSAASFSTM